MLEPLPRPPPLAPGVTGRVPGGVVLLPPSHGSPLGPPGRDNELMVCTSGRNVGMLNFAVGA